MEPAVLSAPPRIKIFESVFVKDETRPQAEYRGVPTLLIDYIVCTALLLVTDKDDYLDFSPTSPSASKPYGRPGIVVGGGGAGGVNAGDNNADEEKAEEEKEETSTFHSLLQSPSSPISQPVLQDEKLFAVHQWVENVRLRRLSSSASSRPSSPSPAQSLSGPSSSRGGGGGAGSSGSVGTGIGAGAGVVVGNAALGDSQVLHSSLMDTPDTIMNEQQSDAAAPIHPYAYGYTGEADGGVIDGENRRMGGVKDLPIILPGERRGSKRNTELHQMFDSMLVVKSPAPPAQIPAPSRPPLPPPPLPYVKPRTSASSARIGEFGESERDDSNDAGYGYDVEDSDSRHSVSRSRASRGRGGSYNRPVHPLRQRQQHNYSLSPSIPISTPNSMNLPNQSDTFNSVLGQSESEFGVINIVNTPPPLSPLSLSFSTSSHSRGITRPGSSAGNSIGANSRPLPRPPTSSLSGGSPVGGGHRPPLPQPPLPAFQQYDHEYYGDQKWHSLSGEQVVDDGIPLPPPPHQPHLPLHLPNSNPNLNSYSQAYLSVGSSLGGGEPYQYSNVQRGMLPPHPHSPLPPPMDYLQNNNESEVTLVVDGNGDEDVYVYNSSIANTPRSTMSLPTIPSSQPLPLPPPPPTAPITTSGSPNSHSQRPIPAKLANEYNRVRSEISPIDGSGGVSDHDRYFSDPENPLSPSSSLSPSSITDASSGTGTGISGVGYGYPFGVGGQQYPQTLRAESIDAYTAHTLSRSGHGSMPLPLQVMNVAVEMDGDTEGGGGLNEVASLHSFELPPPSYDSINWSNSNAARRMHAMQAQVQTQNSILDPEATSGGT